MAPLWETFRDLANSFYMGPFRNAINAGGSTGYYDISVGQAFIGQWRQWLAGPAIERADAAVKLTEDIAKIFGFGQLQIMPSSDDLLLRLIVDGRTYGLSELGTGLAQFILVLANVATRQPAPAFVLIDEPELSLHPSLQLDFLTTLSTYATRGVLFATHTLGLARRALTACMHKLLSTLHAVLRDQTPWSPAHAAVLA